jgi:isocitrate/isopropylmalate dehydrogenase
MSENTARYTIANIPGDGIGNEVVPEGLRVLDAVSSKYGVSSTTRISTGVASATPSWAR